MPINLVTKFQPYTDEQFSTESKKSLLSGDSWTAIVHLHDGVRGHAPTIQRATCATMEAAVDHIHAVSQKYPSSRDVRIIIDDLGR